MGDLDPNSLDKLRVVDLREHLRARGLPTSCLKADLVRRLREALEAENFRKQRYYEEDPILDGEYLEWGNPRTVTADFRNRRFFGDYLGWGIPRTVTAGMRQSVTAGMHQGVTAESTQKLSQQESTPYKGCDCTSKPRVPLPSDKLVEDFKELFLKQEDCDTVIKVNGREFSAHRIILRARSPVFASIFRNNMKEKATGIIEIEDCDPDSFSDFLRFLYCGYLENISTKNVFDLFTTADKYDVQDLRSECLEFMKKNLSVDTFCDTLALALLHCEKELTESANIFFGKNVQKIVETDSWKSFLAENPGQGSEFMVKALVSKK